MAVHIANANPANVNLLRGFPEGFNTMAFALFRVPTIVATYTLLMGEAPKLFPKLRWGIIEASAQWVPWIHHEVARRYEARGLPIPEDMFGERQIYVTCQTDDDIPYVLKYAGPNSIVIGNRLRPHRPIQRDRRHLHLPRDGRHRRRYPRAHPLPQPKGRSTTCRTSRRGMLGCAHAVTTKRSGGIYLASKVANE